MLSSFEEREDIFGERENIIRKRVGIGGIIGERGGYWKKQGHY